MNLLVISQYFKSKGFVENKRPFELNIVGVRSSEQNTNTFNDKMYVWWYDEKGKPFMKAYTITTDPGLYHLQNPGNVKGTAMLKEGQYLKSHQIGLHRQKYKALVQRGNVSVYRDPDRSAFFDFATAVVDTGLFGINIHHASATGESTSVDKWSAGCQVFANISDFNEFMALAEKQKTLYGNSFDYTLIDELALKKKVRRYTVYLVVLGLAVITLVYLSRGAF